MQETKIVLRDDVTGEVIEEGKAQLRVFSVEEKTYELDLNEKSAAAFDAAMEEYTKVARPVASKVRHRSARRSASGKAAAIREWAQKNGYEVSSRGRFSQEVIEAYREAQKKDAPSVKKTEAAPQKKEDAPSVKKTEAASKEDKKG